MDTQSFIASTLDNEQCSPTYMYYKIVISLVDRIVGTFDDIW